MALICGLLSVISCKKQETENPGNDTIHSEFLSTIETTPAVLSNQEEELILSGKITSDPDLTINYVPLVSGVIDRSYFSLGDKVQKGQTLIDIWSAELSQLQSERISLESELKIAERNLLAVQTAFDDSMASEKELLEAQGLLRQTQAAFSKVNQDMSLFGSNKESGTFSIKAPMSGYIIHKSASSGSTISPDSEPLFSITDLSSVWAIANVYAGNLLFVKEGMDVIITSLSYPGESFPGKISALSQVFDSEDKTLKARIALSNKDMKFKPEMSVVVKLQSETHRNCLSIPTDALIFDENRYFVVVETVPVTFEIKEVQLQGHYQQISYIRSGLNENDRVVVKNQLLIYSELKGK